MTAVTAIRISGQAQDGTCAEIGSHPRRPRSAQRSRNCSRGRSRRSRWRTRASACKHQQTDYVGHALVLMLVQVVESRPISSISRNRSRGFSGLRMNPEAGLSVRTSQRIARLNILRMAQPTRFARPGVGRAGRNGFSRFCWVFACAAVPVPWRSRPEAGRHPPDECRPPSARPRPASRRSSSCCGSQRRFGRQPRGVLREIRSIRSFTVGAARRPSRTARGSMP